MSLGNPNADPKSKGETDAMGNWWLAQVETFWIHVRLVQRGLPASQGRERMKLARG
jgi:hypothetical protein